MGMFGLGGGEILIVLILAIVFIGPKDLPRVATQLGRLYRQFKSAAEDLKSTVEKEIVEESAVPPDKSKPE